MFVRVRCVFHADFPFGRSFFIGGALFPIFFSEILSWAKQARTWGRARSPVGSVYCYKRCILCSSWLPCGRLTPSAPHRKHRVNTAGARRECVCETGQRGGARGRAGQGTRVGDAHGNRHGGATRGRVHTNVCVGWKNLRTSRYARTSLLRAPWHSLVILAECFPVT